MRYETDWPKTPRSTTGKTSAQCTEDLSKVRLSTMGKGSFERKEQPGLGKTQAEGSLSILFLALSLTFLPGLRRLVFPAQHHIET